MKQESCKDRSSSRRLIALAGYAAVLLAMVAGSGCNRQRVPINTEDYVEIDNPVNEGNPAESSKIWVPKSSLEKGAPRGRDLVKKGYEKVVGTDGPDAAEPSPREDRLRLRLLVAEEQGAAVEKPLSDLLRRSFVVRSVGKRIPTGTSDEERNSFVSSLANQPGSGLVLIAGAPEGTKPGSVIQVDLYDGRGPLLLRSLSVKVPTPEEGESISEAVVRALSGLTGGLKEVLVRAPWYGRVVAVSGDRIYVDAGAESGLKRGQRLVVYRGGEAVKGLGFAPGRNVASFAITDFVGPDGAFGVASDAATVQAGDYVELEK